MRIDIDPTVANLAVGIVAADGLRIGPACDDLRSFCDEAARQVATEGAAGGEERRQAVRALLRAGGFKPAGRNKPAQEFLCRTIDNDGELPSILNAVDLLNAMSLLSGLPISLLSANRLGDHVVIRYGREDERLVFNRAGQELNVLGLICLCCLEEEDSIPLGSPVKDSMQGKISESDRCVVACIYAPQHDVTVQELVAWAEKLADGFTRWCAATKCRSMILPRSW